MRKSRFTEAQIIGMIKEQESGLPTVEICRKHGLSTATFYKLKGKYGGMEVSDARRLRPCQGRLRPSLPCRLRPCRLLLLDSLRQFQRPRHVHNELRAAALHPQVELASC